MKQIRKISVFVLVFILMLSFVAYSGVIPAPALASQVPVMVLSPAGDITQMAVTWWDNQILPKHQFNTVQQRVFGN